MTLAAAVLDPSICPICRRANRCAMEAARQTGQPPAACWCTQARFDADLLAQVPAEAQGRACICAACAAAAEPRPAR